MTEQRELRVSDADRQAAAERLRAAHDEGRLDLVEYDDRLVQAYAAVSNADLDRLFADLPATTRIPAAVTPSPVARAVPAPVACRRPTSGLPLVLKILWINWVLAVAVNLTVWTLVDGDGDTYFWPMWLGVPRVVLGGASAVALDVRAHRRAALES